MEHHLASTKTKNDKINFSFGEEVEGYAVPVLNEREIRAAAGLMFLALFTAFMFILFKQDFVLVKYVVIIFLTDFLFRVAVSPRLSPLLIIGRMIVARQVPEYVEAAPKKFAWQIGLVLSGLMTVLLVALNSYSIISTSICFACLLFLFFESAFGICIGCVMYRWFYQKPSIYCAGAQCEKRNQEAIQKVSKTQLIFLLCFAFYLLMVVLFFDNSIRTSPHHLKELINPAKYRNHVGFC